MTVVELPAVFRDIAEVVGQCGDAEPPHIFWGAAPTGEPHFGYLATLLAIRLAASVGFHTTLFVADYHGYLDDEKSQWETLFESRQAYAATLAPSFDQTLYGYTEYRTPEYMDGLLRFSRHLSVSEALRSGDGTLRRGLDDRSTAELLYVLMQLYDLQHFEVDVAICGQDESPIYEAWDRLRSGRGILRDSAFLYMPMCPGVEEPEMHASSPQSNRIGLHAEATEIQEKFARHVRLHSEFDARDSPLVRFVDRVILPLVVGLAPNVAEDRPAAEDARYVEWIEGVAGFALKLCATEKVKG